MARQAAPWCRLMAGWAGLAYHPDQANFVLLNPGLDPVHPLMNFDVFAEARGLHQSILDTADAALRELLARYPIPRYLDWLTPDAEPGGYSTLPAPAAEQVQAIRRGHGDAALDRYHRLVLLEAIGRYPAAALPVQRPPSVLRQAEAEFRRITRQVMTAREGAFLPGTDLFDKDLAICRGKLLPCGAQLVDICSGIPRGVVFRGGARQFADALWLGVRAGGFRPWLEMHLDPRALGEFSPAGWDRCYRRIADVLAANPRLRGVFGSSWWFDPAVGRLTPEIAYLRDTPCAHGAACLHVCPDPAPVSNAVKFSKVRKAKFDCGEYNPTIYMIAWRAADVIAYARALTRDGWEV